MAAAFRRTTPISRGRSASGSPSSSSRSAAPSTAPIWFFSSWVTARLKPRSCSSRARSSARSRWRKWATLASWIRATARKIRWPHTSTSSGLHGSSIDRTATTQWAKTIPPRISNSLRISYSSNPCSKRSAPSSIAFATTGASADTSCVGSST
jgi:hypothetical protein